MQCQGTTQKGTQCQLNATDNGYCKLHSDNGGGPQPAKHESRCTVCNHADREKIEARYRNWELSPTEIAEKYGLSRSAVYRHMLYLNFDGERAFNVVGYCEKVMTRALRSESVSQGDGIRAAALAQKIRVSDQEFWDEIREKRLRRAFKNLRWALNRADLDDEQRKSLIHWWETAERRHFPTDCDD